MSDGFFGNDGEPLADPNLLYHTGASEPFGPGTTRKCFLEWCMPIAFRRLCCGAPTVSVTVRVKIEDPNTENPLIDLSNIFGSIGWGSGEGDGPDDQEMDFDVVGGSAVTVQAYKLYVYLSYPASNPTSAAINPIVRVDISVGLGTSGKAGVSASATRTIKVGDLAANGGAGPTPAVPIPMYAVGARILNIDALVPTLDLLQIQAVGGQIIDIDRVGKREIDATPVARGLGARFFQVSNFNAAISHGTAVVFDLCPN